MIDQRRFNYRRQHVVFALLWMSASVVAHPGATDASGCHEDKRTHKTHCHGKPPTQLPKPNDEGVFSGPVRWVSDGDTFIVHVRGRDMEIRLADVDAPERDQPYGWEAKLALIDAVRDREVIVVPFDVDRYGRVIAYAYVGSTSLSRRLVDEGAAWFYTQYANDVALYDAEEVARRLKKGLWNLPLASRVEPWEWRRRQRDARADKSASPLK